MLDKEYLQVISKCPHFFVYSELNNTNTSKKNQIYYEHFCPFCEAKIIEPFLIEGSIPLGFHPLPYEKKMIQTILFESIKKNEVKKHSFFEEYKKEKIFNAISCIIEKINI